MLNSFGIPGIVITVLLLIGLVLLFKRIFKKRPK